MFTKRAIEIFENTVSEYHLCDDVNHPSVNPYPKGSLEFLLCEKNWTDAVQWHLEDIVRDPDIEPAYALEIKRRIDALNQYRTDTVEYIDSYFLQKYADVKVLPDAHINTETPAWAIDRLSILQLKIYHMRCEAERAEASEEHRTVCSRKLATLLEQQRDLSTAIEELLDDIAAGRKYMKTYKQMKMYNDPSLNPVLYGNNK